MVANATNGNKVSNEVEVDIRSLERFQRIADG
jgi:hypothetical protein